MSSPVPAPSAGNSASSLRPLQRPSLLVGKYRLFAALGRGGMADVYLGAATGPAGFNKLVVIKKLRDGRADDPSSVSMFLDEARLSARLNHPNVVHTYQVEEADDGYILVMEYLEGQSLRALLRTIRAREQFCDPALAAYLIAEALQGLHHVHELRDYDGSALGIVHRDVSPQNLIVTYDGQVKVLDFGIAKATLNATDTQDGVLKGKFAYMAPEHASGGNIDRRTDLFAAGVVLWELLTGEPLFRGDTATVLLQLVHAQIPKPSSILPSIPPELDAIVLKALQRAPHQRYESALEMSRALSDFLLNSGRVVRREDVASLMLELFAAARDDMARQVQTYMASQPREFIPVIDTNATQKTPASSAAASASDSLLPTELEQQTPKRRGVWLGISAGFVTAAAAWAGVVLLQPRLTEGRTLNPTSAVSELSPRTVRTQVEESFHLTLSSDPPEADVQWGGKIIGRTPMLIDLMPGPQTFVITRDGYLTATVVVNVTPNMAGQSQPRSVVMVPRPPSARVVTLRARSASQPEPTSPRVEARPLAQRESYTAVETPLALPETQPAQTSPSMTATTTTPTRIAAPAAPSVAVAPRPTQPTVPTVLPFGPEMTRPVLLSSADLVYPREALVARVSGTVIARCTITTEGSLHSCRIIKGLPFLDKPMLDSLATRRYRPVLYQGRPVSVQYVFNLRIEPPS